MEAVSVIGAVIIFALIVVIGKKLRDKKREGLDPLNPEELPNERDQDRQERQQH